MHVLEDGETIRVDADAHADDDRFARPRQAPPRAARLREGLLFAGDAVGVRLPDAGILRPPRRRPTSTSTRRSTSLRQVRRSRPDRRRARALRSRSRPDGDARRGQETLRAVGRGRGAGVAGGPRHRRPRWTRRSAASCEGVDPVHREKLETLNGIHSNAAGFRRWLDNPRQRPHRTTATTPALHSRAPSSSSIESRPAAAAAAVTVDVEIPTSRFRRGASVGDAQRRQRTATVESVAIVWRVVDATVPVRMFRHGYQSWSPCGWRGVRRRRATRRAHGRYLAGRRHAPRRPADRGGRRAAERARHRARGSIARPGAGARVHSAAPSTTAPSGCGRRDAGVELWAEAFLGGDSSPATPASCTRWRPRHRRSVGCARRLGGRCRVRRAAPARPRRTRSVGAPGTTTSTASPRPTCAPTWRWPASGRSTCSSSTTATSPAIGDWLDDQREVPVGARRHRRGHRGGRAVAGHLDRAVPRRARLRRSRAEHPDWIARHASAASRSSGMVNDALGRRRCTYARHHAPEVLAHLETVARDARRRPAIRYLKLDFTYAPGLRRRLRRHRSRRPPSACGPASTRSAGARATTRSSSAAVRRSAPCVGVVDGKRIGPDVAPWWDAAARRPVAAGLQRAPRRRPSTRWRQHAGALVHAPAAVAQRSGLPDAANRQQTTLSRRAGPPWALAVGVTGGMALVSDDLALLDADARALLDEVVAVGRAHDKPRSCVRNGPYRATSHAISVGQAIGSTSARISVR